MQRLCLCLLLLLIVTLTSCTDNTQKLKTVEQTGEKEVVGYVNADGIYKINIEKRIKDVFDAMRGARGLFFQPELDDIIALHYVSFRREVRNVGVKQPGMTIDRKMQTDKALRLMEEKLERIYKRAGEGATLPVIAKEFNFDEPQTAKEIKKGDIPEWDELLWKTELDAISEPYVSSQDERVYIFHILEKNTNASPNWVTAEVLSFSVPMETAKRNIEEEQSKTWDIKIQNGFYDSLQSYFNGNLDDALQKLDSYLKSNAGKSDYLAYFFMSRLLKIKYQLTPDDSLKTKVKANLEKAIDMCTEVKLEPHFRYELYLFYTENGDSASAQEQLKLALENLHSDLSMARKIREGLAESGDAETILKADEKIKVLEDQLKDEIMSKPREVTRSSKVQAGESYLFEDIDEIIGELEEIKQLEQELDFLDQTEVRNKSKMKLQIDCRLILIGAFLLFVVCGCTSGGIKTTLDETGEKKIIGYVDADPFFQISITEKIREYVDYSRDEGTILYQPTAEETIKLQYLALRKVIVETMLKQPGNKVSPSEIIDLSRQIALKRGEEIAGRLREGISFEAVSEEFKIPVQLDPVRVFEGNNPGYDKYIWDAQPDVITGPVEYLDRVLIFKIVGKGVSEGNDWIDMMIVDFLFPRDEARREAEKKLLEKSEIKISDKYYFALNAYYRDDLDASESALEELVKEKAHNDGMTEYLLARINLIRTEKTSDSTIEKKIESNYLSAIKNSTDIKLKPYFRYELGQFYLKKNDTASAVKEFKDALSELRTDLQLTALLNDLAIQIGDEEFQKLASEKLKSLQEIYQSELVKQPKKDITSPGGISLGDE